MRGFTCCNCFNINVIQISYNYSKNLLHSNDYYHNLICKCVLTYRILYLVTHFVDLAYEMYHLHYLRMAL